MNLRKEDFTLLYFFAVDSNQREGGLAKSINDVLLNPSALGYFIQFMESRGSVALIKFCLEVESFRASKIETPSSGRTRKDSSSEFGNFQSADEEGSNCDTSNLPQSNLNDNNHDPSCQFKTTTTTNGRNSSPSNSDEDNSAYDVSSVNIFKILLSKFYHFPVSAFKAKCLTTYLYYLKVLKETSFNTI